MKEVDNMSQKAVTNSKTNLLAMAQIAVCAALLCVSAFITIPIPFLPVPFTMQVLAVILVALLLKPTHSLAAALIYTLLGIAGLPVFSGGKGGFGVILSPTGGFIIGFLFAAFFVSLAKGKTDSLPRYILSAALVGIPCIYIPGIAMYILYTNADLWTAVASLTSVFILADLAKCVIASLLALVIRRALLKAKLLTA